MDVEKRRQYVIAVAPEMRIRTRYCRASFFICPYFKWAIPNQYIQLTTFSKYVK